MQDVDLVWFREPWDYLHSFISPMGVQTDIFWTDDGAHGLRYTPFFGNSGFYYVRWSRRTEYWAWSVVTAYDNMHTSGSHQNVVTMRTMEAMDLLNLTVKILPMNDFPNGAKFHNDKPYMKKIKEGLVHPYHFHMCWTSHRGDKVKYFKESDMWYLTAVCEAQGAVRPGGRIFENILRMKADSLEKQKSLMYTDCCSVMQSAP